MKAGGGKAKGGQYEREVCKKLSLWLSLGKREDLLWRSAMSGGRATVAHKAGKANEHVGDISAVTDEGYRFTRIWATECKHYADITLESLLTLKKGHTAYGFWCVLVEQAKTAGKCPMLIFRQNRMPSSVLMFQKDLDTRFKHKLGAALSSAVVIQHSSWGANDVLVLVDFEDFLLYIESPIKDLYASGTGSGPTSH